MKKMIGNILLAIATAGMVLYLMANLTATQQILVTVHFGIVGLLIYTVASGFGEVNKRLDGLARRIPEHDKHNSEKR